MIYCPDCGRLISLRFPIHECKPKPETRYAVQLENTGTVATLYVLDHADYGRTASVQDAKTWKTQSGAERFMETRYPGRAFHLVTVELSPKTGRPLKIAE